MNRQERFSLRKYKFGVASVLLGAVLVFGSAQASAEEQTAGQTSAGTQLVANSQQAPTEVEHSQGAEVPKEATVALQTKPEEASKPVEKAAEVATPTSSETTERHDVTEKPQSIESDEIITVPQTWKQGYKGEGMVVAVIDSGLDVNHEVLRITDPSKAKFKNQEEIEAAKKAAGIDYGKWYNDKVVYAYDYFDGTDNIKEAERDSHGMHVTGIATGNPDKEAGNGEKIYGVAPEAQVMFMRVFSDRQKTTGSALYVKAIDDAVALGADTINMSLGSTTGSMVNADSDIVDAIKRARAKGVSVLISAGNSNTFGNGYSRPAAENPDYGLVGNPSTVEDSISVASINNNVITTEVFEVKGLEGNAEADNGKFDYSKSAADADFEKGKEYEYVSVGLGKEDDFKGIIDLFEMKAYIYNDEKGDDISIVDIPEDMKEDAELYHTELIEKICELDDDLMMEYLEGEEPTVERLKATLRKATCECTAVPVCCGSAYRNKGVQKLLDAILEYMPAPTDIPPIEGTDLDGNPVVRHSSDEEPFAALAFKIMTDPFVGKLAYFRVYSGTMNSGSYVLNATKDKKERVGRILQMHANKRMELDKVYSGDIAAAIGFKFTTTGDTICDEQHPVILESMEFPEPVIELAIEPKTKAGQGKLGEALAKLAEEDPTFRAHTDQETGQTIIAGMGELHLDIIVDRLLREFKVEANVGAPQVAYKETITKAVDVDSKYAKQSGGRGQYGHCKVKFEPMDANGEELYKFESTVVGGAIPKEYIPAVGEGIEEAMKAGILGGYPVVGVHANVYDGSYHEVDSSEMAFHIAGSLAFKDAMQKAAPILLEPIMKVEVTTPEDYMGDVIGDINSRRGRIEGMDDIGGGKMIRGYVPLSEMFGYATDLRSRTQGRGNYSMFFEKYEPVPKSVQEKVLAKKD